ncbi:MAG: rhomboid family intramembrane serine protease [Deltaproteobacteria bacterium]|nr:MAG: rhomboid family intramembrane serine protease [Deltaproteobacteria bacterium]
MPEPTQDALLRLAAAATLQRATWGDRSVHVPLARPERVEADQIELELADGSWLILAAPQRAHQARADLRRWAAHYPESRILALLLLDQDARAELLDAPPDRPSPTMQVALLQTGACLWDEDWPQLADVLTEAADRRPPPPPDTLERLEQHRDLPWPPRSSPPPTEIFERLVYSMAHAHDLVRLVRGEARLRLRAGGQLTVLAATGDPEVDHASLAAALASMAPALARDPHFPALIMTEGPPDLQVRVADIFGKRALRGSIHAIGPLGAVQPPSAELRALTRLALRFDGPRDLWSSLEIGLERRDAVLSREADAAGERRIGLIDGLLDLLPDARLRWLHATLALVQIEGRELQVRWVGPEGGEVGDAVQQWRLAAAAGRWSRTRTDLLLVGGDQSTWQRATKAMPGASEGHVYHLGADGRVRARAGALGQTQPLVRALRRWLKRPELERLRGLHQLKQRLERKAVDEFRAMVADADFRRRLFAATPWATRLLLVAIAAGYLLQMSWDATTGPGAVRMGALTGEGLFSGEPWRWLSAAFLHASWWHIALNAWALWILGRRLEAMLGPHRFAILFLLSCIGGSMLHEAFSSPGDIAVGASTGVLGVLAAQGALVLRRPDLVPPRIRRLLWREAWINGLLILGISLLPFVGGLAHLGGAIAGFGLVFSGLITLGVSTGNANSEGPTQIETPPAWYALTAALAAAATVSILVAISLGEPWILQQPEGRVRDVVLDDGALTVPLPGSAGPPSLQRRPDGARVVIAGDALRDGLQVHYEARPTGHPEPLDLDVLRVLRGSPELPWETGSTPDGPFLSASPSPRPTTILDALSPTDRLVRQRFLVERDGVIVSARVIGTADVVRSRLSGTWKRIPAGIAAQPAAWDETDPAPDVAAFLALSEGTPLPDLHGLDDDLRRALTLAAAVRDGGPLSDSALDDPSARARALALSEILAGAGQVELALSLNDALRSVTPADRLDPLRVSRSRIFEEAGRPRDALSALESTRIVALHQAQLAWQAGEPDRAERLAREWLAREEPWWVRPADLASIAPASWRGNRGWGKLLAGDPNGCVSDSRQALQDEPSLVFARYNLGLCLLVQGDVERADEQYRQADRQAREQRLGSFRRAAARDLLRLAHDGVPGAQEQYRHTFGDLQTLPGYAL